MNFFVNEAMGIGNSGIEHAQFYRAKLFKSVNIPYRFLFMSLVPNIHEAMNKWHLTTDEVINMWEYFVFEDDSLENKIQADYKATQTTVIDRTNTNRARYTLTSSGMYIVEHIVKYKRADNTLVVAVSRKELYDFRTNDLKVSYEYVQDRRHGSVVANIHLFSFKGKHLFFRNMVELRHFFFVKMDEYFNGNSLFLLDRGEDSEAALFYHKIPNMKIIDVIHADQLADRDDPQNPLWNNYYEYLLTHMERVDKVVVATKLQRKDMLIDFPTLNNKICTIPVGGIRDQSFVPKSEPDINPNPFKMISLSRLSPEKHIDLAIRAVCGVHNVGRNITLDIYGLGEEAVKLQKIIDKNNANSYIKLKGLTNEPEKVYPKYNAFISASFSEGFGLTYIEALNASLPVVTFNARFGAPELIRDGVNGYLEEFKRDDEEYNIRNLVEGILRIMGKDNYQKLRQNTIKSVCGYQDKYIAKEWEKLINALRDNKCN